MIKLVIFIVLGVLGYSVYTGATSIEDVVENGQQIVHTIAKTVANATEDSYYDSAKRTVGETVQRVTVGQ
jgi:small ligand-binding sensory domain FIST